MATRAPVDAVPASTKKPVAKAKAKVNAKKVAPPKTVVNATATAPPATKKARVAKKVAPANTPATAKQPILSAPLAELSKAVPKALPNAVSAVKPIAATKAKPKKAKLVRDSFTMPEDEYQVLSDVKKACLKAGLAVKKSELLRIGVSLIKGLDNAKLKAAIASLPLVKAGRPKKDK
ncbi:hypothetical protein [Glaciimonas immobilis]|uniref:Uncharacterized protein n=1 Tax=Glaciimonas immobilis TaxID=728004 RepID=A0A840RL61_9BURK|nr:hypothetical protein [Glaciimonas immobilis]KAF3999479.1 hypothetical protein HAV38_06065 [Glaciimonas immobilis]MBB5198997.1 hypothetical protein [Glaciimonas immobilis]